MLANLRRLLCARLIENLKSERRPGGGVSLLVQAHRSIIKCSAIEALGHLAPAPRIQTHQSNEWKTLRAARTCYNHLAGQFAVAIHNEFQHRGFLQRVSNRECNLTDAGLEWFEKLGGALTGHRRGRLCIDWTERHYHIGGPLGGALLACLCERKWIARMKKTRAVRLTVEGRVGLNKSLGLSI